MESQTGADAPVRPADRYRALDGLRGVAALLVVVYHVALVVPAIADVASGLSAPPTGSLEWWLYRTPVRLLFAGREAVLVFFLLSGFVLTLPLLRGARQNRWRAYYPRRIARLLLPVWGALAVSLVLALLVTRNSSLGSVWLQTHTSPTSHDVVKDSVLVLGTSNLDSPLWSLRWEMCYSLLLPLVFGSLLLLRTRRWWPGAIALAIGLAVLGRFPAVQRHLPLSWLTTGLLEYVPIFAIGMLAAIHRDAIARCGAAVNRAARARGIWVGLTTAGLLLAVSPSIIQSPPRHFDGVAGVGYAASLGGACLLLFVALEWADAGRALQTRRVQWLGTRSFSLYLIHEPIIVAVALATHAHGYFPWLLVAVPVLLAVGVSTEVFYRLVELPAHRLARLLGTLASRPGTEVPAGTTAHRRTAAPTHPARSDAAAEPRA